MDPFAVELTPQRSSDAFTARYDEESGLLLLETDNPHDWPHGTTLDGLLTLDLDANRVLVHVELTWPRTRWPSGSVELPHPDRSRISLRLPFLSTDLLGAASPDVEVVETPNSVVISWDKVPTARRVPLGDHVTALLAAGRLTGFAVESEAFD